MTVKGPVVLSLSFGEEGEIEMAWTDVSTHDDYSALVTSEVITEAGQNADEQVGYWSRELRQSVDEFLGAWRNYKRDKVKR